MAFSEDDTQLPYKLLDAHEEQRLSDGREELGGSFADPTYADEHVLAGSFADPNSIDDIKLGNSFAETNSSAKKHHRPIKEALESPFHKRSSHRVLYWVIATVAIVFLVSLFAGWIPRHNRNKETAERSKQEAGAEPVIEVVRVTHAKANEGLVIPGTTTPLTESSVYARANGYLKKRFVDIGDHVRKGQLLAIVDAPDLDQQVDQAREQVSQAQAQLAQQQTQLALTDVTVTRYRALVAKGVFSRQDGDQREADFQAQRASVSAAERNVEAFRANLRRVLSLQSYERVTAPFDGVVTQRNVDAGDLISAQGSAGGGTTLTPSAQSASGSANVSGSSGNGANLATNSTGGGQGGALFTVAQNGRLRILVSVPEGYASLIRLGQPASLHFQELPNAEFSGTVTRTAGSIDQNTRTLLTEVQVDNTAGRLLSGMYAVVTFAAAPGGGPLVVSGDSIAIRDDRPTVALITNGEVHLTPVTIGRDYGAEVEIVQGLRDGDLIASTFTDDVVEGAKVKTRMNQQDQKKAQPSEAAGKPNPPGGSTQYGNAGIVDENMQGQAGKPQQKKAAGGAAKGGAKP